MCLLYICSLLASVLPTSALLRIIRHRRNRSLPAETSLALAQHGRRERCGRPHQIRLSIAIQVRLCQLLRRSWGRQYHHRCPPPETFRSAYSVLRRSALWRGTYGMEITSPPAVTSCAGGAGQVGPSIVSDAYCPPLSAARWGGFDCLPTVCGSGTACRQANYRASCTRSAVERAQVGSNQTRRRRTRQACDSQYLIDSTHVIRDLLRLGSFVQKKSSKLKIRIPCTNPPNSAECAVAGGYQYRP